MPVPAKKLRTVRANPIRARGDFQESFVSPATH
jgi:hypothetical protein